MASHMARQGTFINKDGYLQFQQSASTLHSETKPLLAIIATLLGDGIFTCKEVWEQCMLEVDMLQDISLKR